MRDELVELASSGDRAAMTRVLESVAPSIRRFALRMCRNVADAEDVVQDALLSIATSLPSFEGRSTLATWAFTVARTACARRRRGRKNAPAETDAVLEMQSSDAPGPDERAETDELRARVTDALDALPEEYREVLLLRDGEGFTAPEAAAVLQISVDALKSRLHRARSALRDVLRPLLDADAPHDGRCPDVVAALSRHLENDLDAQACAEMEQHIERCPACARTCDGLKAALRACRRSTSRDVPAAVQAEVKRAVDAWIGGQRSS